MAETTVTRRPMKATVKVALVLFVFGLIGIFFHRLYWPEASVTLANQTLRVQVADSLYRQIKGLGGRSKLAPYDGLLFVFSGAGEYGFVMRDMKFPIDIIWFDNGRVVDIAPRVAPEPGVPEAELRRYVPRKPANLVLEAPAGWAEAHGLKIGDLLQVNQD